MLYLKKPKSLFSLVNDDHEYLHYAIKHYTNKEIATEKVFYNRRIMIISIGCSYPGTSMIKPPQSL